MARPGDLLVDRAHADHLAGRERHALDDAALQELARRSPLAQELAGEVHPDDGVPLLERHGGERGILL